MRKLFFILLFLTSAVYGGQLSKRPPVSKIVGDSSISATPQTGVVMLSVSQASTWTISGLYVVGNSTFASVTASTITVSSLTVADMTISGTGDGRIESNGNYLEVKVGASNSLSSFTATGFVTGVASTTKLWVNGMNYNKTYLDMTGFSRVSHASYTTDMTLSSGGLFGFDSKQSTGNWMATLVHFPKSNSAYDIVLSSLVIGSTGTIIDTMNFTLWIATIGSTGFNSPVWNAPVNVTITDDITSGGFAVASGVVLTNWKTEIDGRDIDALVRIAENVDDNLVDPLFIRATFEVELSK